MSGILNTVAAYVPHRLVQRMATAVSLLTIPEYETLPTAVLFADISGFTPLTELLAETGSEGLEEMTRLLNDNFSRIIGLITAEGGDVVQFSGDGITAVFPADTEPLSTATRRAYQAGMAIQETMKEIGRLQTSAGEITIGLKVVIGAGEIDAVIAGGSRHRWEYIITGDPLRQIAIAEAQAERGQITFSPEAAAIMAAEAVPPHPLSPLDWQTLADTAVCEQNLSYFLPTAVHTWLAQGLHDWIGVYRPMTVLFIGISGLQDSHRYPDFLYSVQEIVYQYEGSINKLAVDDKGPILLALFGAPPFAHEDDALRALRCGRDLQAVAQAQGLQLTIGVTSGRVFVGPIGSPSRREYTVMGDRVNVAARLMAQAEPGTIWADYDTYRLTQAQLPWQPLTPVQLKGKAGFVRVYRLSDEAQMARPTSARQPLIGRQTELAQLTAYVDGLQRGDGRILIIEGEAGIGKSRLAAELLPLAADRGLVGLSGAAQSIEQQTTYRAWRDVFSSYFGLEEGDTLLQRHEKVQDRVMELVPELAERLPLLNDVLNLELPNTPLVRALTGQARHNSLVLFLIELLEKWLAERPLILLLEDAHWFDSLSWDLALQLARTFMLEDRPFFLVLVMRPLTAQSSERLAALQAIRALTATRTLQLEPLPAADTVALAAARLGLTAVQLPPTITDLIQTRAGGNPFFAEEIVYALRDNGLLRLNGHDPELIGDPEEISQMLPGTLQGIVLSRIDRLAPAQQLTLKVASVIGRSFGFAALRGLLDEHTQISEPVLHEHLAHFVDRDLTVLELPEPDLTFVFKHIITREVAYETLLHTQRRQLHRSVALWYEQQMGEEALYPYYAVMVYHWHQAGDKEREGVYARLAGLKAAAQYANQEALAYFDRALALTAESQLRERFDLLLAREQVNFYYAAREAQARDLATLAELAEKLDDNRARATVAWRQARYGEQTGNYTAASQSAQQAVDWAQLAGDSVSEAEALNQWAHALVRQGYYEEAMALYERALRLNRVAKDERREGQTLTNVATLHFYWGKFDELNAFAEEAIALNDKYADRLGKARCLNLLGLACYETEQFTQAIRHYEQALVTYTDIGDRRGQAAVYSNLGNVYADYGDYEWAEAYYERAIGIDRQTGDRGGEAVNLITLGMLRNELGEYEAARASCGAALDILTEIGDRANEIYALVTMANILCNMEDFAPAVSHAALAWGINQDLEQKDFDLTILIEWSRALLGLEQWPEAQEICQRLLAVCEQYDERAYRIYGLAGLGEIAWRNGRSDEAATLAKEIVSEVVEHIPEFFQELFRVYLLCYRILARVDEGEARRVLAEAYGRLMERANKIGDDFLRDQFLENVSVYRDIVRLYKEIGD